MDFVGFKFHFVRNNNFADSTGSSHRKLFHKNTDILHKGVLQCCWLATTVKIRRDETHGTGGHDRAMIFFSFTPPFDMDKEQP